MRIPTVANLGPEFSVPLLYHWSLTKVALSPVPLIVKVLMGGLDIIALSVITFDLKA